VDHVILVAASNCRNWVSPAAQRIIDGAPFDLDGDHFYVDDHFKSYNEPTRDVLVIRGVEYMRCDERKVRRAVQVRDVEAWIAQDRVDFAFGPPALDLNHYWGWRAGDVPAKMSHLLGRGVNTRLPFSPAT
jgi:hypothetical protein